MPSKSHVEGPWQGPCVWMATPSRPSLLQELAYSEALAIPDLGDPVLRLCQVRHGRLQWQDDTG
eukprot:16254098-Heterocapsa_arctica.AAC.1